MKINKMAIYEFEFTPTERDSIEETMAVAEGIIEKMEKSLIGTFINTNTGELFDRDDLYRLGGILSGLLEEGDWYTV